MFCESCGKKIPEDSLFCEFCGSKVNHGPESSFHNEEDFEEVEQNTYKEMDEQAYKTDHKEKKSKILLIGLVAIISLGVIIAGYSILNKALKNKADTGDNASLGLHEKETVDKGGVAPEKNNPLENLPPSDPTEVEGIPAVDQAAKEAFDDIGEEDFGWYFDLDFDEAPEGVTMVEYKNVLGDWKIMAISYEAEFAEIYYSFGDIEEYSSNEEFTWANTSVTFNHKYVDYAGEKYPFDEEDATDKLFASFDGDVLEMVFEEDRLVYVLFWEEKGNLYGVGHLFEDDDNDGFADLKLVLAFTR